MTVLFNSRSVSNSAARDFVRGASSIFNLRGNTMREYDFAESAADADRQAIENDWIAVGGDMNEAIKSYRKNVG
jgi:hypothetical protein